MYIERKITYKPSVENINVKFGVIPNPKFMLNPKSRWWCNAADGFFYLH